MSINPEFKNCSAAYEFRVGGQCIPEGGFSYSPVNTFTTPSREEASQYNVSIRATTYS